MKRKLIALSRRYVTALREHLKQGRLASLQPARVLGRQAVAIGLETLDVARIHEEAIATLESSSSRDGIIGRADIFFTEAVTPIEKTHLAAIKTNLRLSQLNKQLDRRKVELATSNRLLKQGVAQRKAVEAVLKKRAEHSGKLLQESFRLQRHLQHLAHQILSSQEENRKKASRDLNDDIAQTLLGINVRLLTLKKEAAVNADELKKEIVSTQRLVDKSVKSIQRFACEFGIHHGT